MVPIVYELAIIGISRVNKRGAKGLRVEYHPFLLIQSQNRELIEYLHRQFPYAYKWSDKRSKTTIWVFEVKGKAKLKALLEHILPYIQTDRERWEALWEYVNISRATPEEAEYYRSIINRR